MYIVLFIVFLGIKATTIFQSIKINDKYKLKNITQVGDLGYKIDYLYLTNEYLDDLYEIELNIKKNDIINTILMYLPFVNIVYSYVKGKLMNKKVLNILIEKNKLIKLDDNEKNRYNSLNNIDDKFSCLIEKSFAQTKPSINICDKILVVPKNAKIEASKKIKRIEQVIDDEIERMSQNTSTISNKQKVYKRV